MKRIGLVGGLCPESTREYEKIICDEYNRRVGGLNTPEMVVYYLNLQKIADLQNKNRWDLVGAEMVKAIFSLRDAGADFAAIASNTPHNAYNHIITSSPLEVLSIVDAAAEKIHEDNISNVGLLGTKQTMELGYFQKVLESRDISTFVPDEKGRDFIDRVIFEELVHGATTQAAKEGYIRIIKELAERGAEGIILGCTEIPLLIKQEDVPTKVYDTTAIHAKAILEYALKE